MNKLFASALIAAAGFVAAPSFAGQYLGGEVGGFAPDAQAPSTLTRAQLQAEATRAVQQGVMIGGRVLADRPVVATAASDVTRAQVRAEAVYAVQQGLLIGGEV